MAASAFILTCLRLFSLSFVSQTAAITSPAQEPRQLSRTKSIKQFVDGIDDTTMKRTRDIFNLCDADGDGIITKSELFKLVKELGYALPRASVLSITPPPYHRLSILNLSAQSTSNTWPWAMWTKLTLTSFLAPLTNSVWR